LLKISFIIFANKGNLWKFAAWVPQDPTNLILLEKRMGKIRHHLLPKGAEQKEEQVGISLIDI